ncbi:MAG: hypothetical protein KatS3mg117_3211 [Geminicoccaceae bacterium]|jgi:hypothetical protein|nr:MAG: hypothetical protein KatS3mg117_3211 [Geminicoccaceae bacterium]
MRFRTLLLTTTFLTFASFVRAEPVMLDGTALDGVVAGRLRATFFTVGAMATATANGVESRSDATATMSADRRSMSARTVSRAAARWR